jgi:transcriptional regulator with PAS, ATPase and Fis domain
MVALSSSPGACRASAASASATLGLAVFDAQGRRVCVLGLARRAGIARAAQAIAAAGDAALTGQDVGGEAYLFLARGTGDGRMVLVVPAAGSDALLEFLATVDLAPLILEHLLTNPYEAMTVVDAEARLRYLSPVHRRFFGLAPGEGIGRPVTEVIENTRLQEVVRSGRPEVGQVQEMRGVSRVVSRMPIVADGRVVGAIGQVMFKAPDTVHALSREIAKLKSEVAFYRRELSERRPAGTALDALVGTSDAIRGLKSDLARIAPLDVSVLLVGESGTGKELAAQALHALSQRAERPLVTVNAAALPATLVESELFGYEPGAFTGAERKGRRGKFELADKSTLFFDEIGDMPPEIQVKLLRVLQDGAFERVGSERPRYSDFRLICATHRDFRDLVDAGRFRLDLYYRVSGVVVRMPGLRDRLEDIPLLVQHFLAQWSARHRTGPKRVAPAVYGYLREQPWPGNVRQLLHEVERAAIFSDGPEITVASFRASGGEGGTAEGERRRGMHRALGEVELAMIREAIARHGGNKKRAAASLGISRSYLYKRLGSAD